MRKPFFIAGYMHSGTTLLHNILKKDSTACTPAGDTHFFDLLPMHHRRPNS